MTVELYRTCPRCGHKFATRAQWLEETRSRGPWRERYTVMPCRRPGYLVEVIIGGEERAHLGCGGINRDEGEELSQRYMVEKGMVQ